MKGQSVIAIDLGASSGRCVLVSLKEGRLHHEEINRFPHSAEEKNGILCWNLGYIWRNIQAGLEKAFAQNPDIASIAVDSWAVDFVPIDAQGKALLPFVSYRDARTQGIMPKFLEESGITDRELFNLTGIQSLELNSLYQLYAIKKKPPKSYEALDRWMLLPDWIHFMLTGNWASEYTNATTTQMLNVKTADWDPFLLEKVGLERSVMPKILRPGKCLGKIKPEFCEKWGLKEAPSIFLPGTHDTASAVAALPSLAKNAYFISLGTWALVGREASEPDLSDYAHDHGLSNEGGIFDTYRQLRNVSGLWLIQSVKQEMAPESDFSEWVKQAEEVEPGKSLIYPMDDRFFRTNSMVQEIQDACRQTGQPIPQSRGEFARCIFDSLALNFADVLDDFRKDEKISELHIVGGGGRNHLLCQLVADYLGAPVVAGPFEASALGNAIMQMIGLGWIPNLEEGRKILRDSEELLLCEPGTGESRNAIRARYRALTSPGKEQN